MEQVMGDVASSRPSYLPWIFNYLKLWFHGPLNSEGYENGVVRFMGPHQLPVHCCFESETLNAISNAFNISVEYVAEETLEYEETNRTAVNPMIMFAENEADIFGSPYYFWKPMFENKAFDASDVALSQTIRETYHIATLVPKHLERKNVFNFLSVLPLSAWYLLVLSFIVFTIVIWLYNKFIILRHNDRRANCRKKSKKKRSLLDVFFFLITLTLGHTIRLSPLTLLWSFCVSLVLIEIMKGQLLTELASAGLVWPDTIEKLSQNRHSYNFYAPNPLMLKHSRRDEIRKLAEKTKTVRTHDVNAVLQKLSDGKTALVGRSAEIESLEPLFSKDKFILLDERYFLSQFAFFVSKKFRYWRESLQLTQRMIEAGMLNLHERGSIVASLMFRLTNPSLLHYFLTFERQQELSLEDMKGVFSVLVFGVGLVLFFNAVFLLGLCLNLMTYFLKKVLLKLRLFISTLFTNSTVAWQ